MVTLCYLDGKMPKTPHRDVEVLPYKVILHDVLVAVSLEPAENDEHGTSSRVFDVDVKTSVLDVDEELDIVHNDSETTRNIENDEVLVTYEVEVAIAVELVSDVLVLSLVSQNLSDDRARSR